MIIVIGCVLHCNGYNVMIQSGDGRNGKLFSNPPAVFLNCLSSILLSSKWLRLISFARTCTSFHFHIVLFFLIHVFAASSPELFLTFNGRLFKTGKVQKNKQIAFNFQLMYNLLINVKI